MQSIILLLILRQWTCEKFGVNKLYAATSTFLFVVLWRNDVHTDLYVMLNVNVLCSPCEFHSARLGQLIVEQTRAPASIRAADTLFR